MLKIIIPFLVLFELAGAADICPQLFSVLSSEKKASQLTAANRFRGVFHLIGAGGFVERMLDDVGDKSQIFMGGRVEYDKDFSLSTYEPDHTGEKKPPAVREERLKRMLEAGIREIYEKKEMRNPKELKGKRRLALAHTAVTKDKEVGYMWTGVIVEFRPEEFVELRLELSLHNTIGIREQKESVGIFEINLLHALLRFEDFENPEQKISALLNSLKENLYPGEIKINDFYADRVKATEGRVHSAEPLFHNSVDVVNLSRSLFKKNQARSLMISNSELVDPREVSFKRNVMVKAIKNLGQILHIGDLKAEFEQKAVGVSPQEKGNLFVVALEDGPNVDIAVARLNSAGIAVWLFKNDDAATSSDSVFQRVSAKRDYIEKFSGRLHVFGAS